MKIKHDLGLIVILWLFGISLCCDENACRTGTSIGTAACGIGASVGGGILCAVTFGIGCGVAAGIGAACPAIGTAVETYACPACGSSGAQNADLPLSAVSKTINEQTELMVELNNKLKQNQRKLFHGQDTIIQDEGDQGKRRRTDI